MSPILCVARRADARAAWKTRQEVRSDEQARPLALAAATILLPALNTRIPTTSLGPVLPRIQADTGHGEGFLSLLTAIPLALTLVTAPLTPRLARRFGRDAVLSALLIAIAVGIRVRSVPDDIPLLGGTVVLGVAIALGTVLIPAVVAGQPPQQRTALTSVYSMALSLGPALALGLTLPLLGLTGSSWRGALMIWSGLALLALALWMLHVRSRHTKSSADGSRPDKGAATAAPETDSNAPAPIRDLRVWHLAVYLGITSQTFYTTSTWLPTTFVAGGLGAQAAGALTSLINLIAIPFSLLAPVLMDRGLARLTAPLAPVIAVGGVAVLLIAGPDAGLAATVLLGISQGLCLGVSYGQVVRFSRSAQHATSVSALTSAVGIALAAAGPLAFGLGLEHAASWTVPVMGLGAVLLVQAVIGLRSGRLVSAGG